MALAYAQNEQALVDAVAQEHFALSNEEREAFEADPSAMLPKLGARVLLRSQQLMMGHLDRMIPTMIQRHVEVLGRQNAGKNEFYRTHPDLNRGQHDGFVDTYARLIRSQNPNMPRAEFIETLGRVVRAMVGTTVPARQPTPQAPAANGSLPPHAARPAPFVPAGGSPPSAPLMPEADPWAGLGQEYED
jgi:hypothetical protein